MTTVKLLLYRGARGKNVVVMSLEEYNSINETLHLTGSRANGQQLDEAIAEMRSGKSSKHKLHHDISVV